MKTEYTLVVSCKSFDTFIERVNEYLAVGWQCQGGVSVTETETDIGYYQAMIRVIET